MTNLTFMREIEDYALRNNLGLPAQVVIGLENKWANKGEIPDEKLNTVLSWQDGKYLLNYTYHRGFGSVECHAVYVWTESAVIFVSQYDGATCLQYVLRNPISCVPEIPGG